MDNEPDIFAARLASSPAVTGVGVRMISHTNAPSYLHVSISGFHRLHYWVVVYRCSSSLGILLGMLLQLIAE